MCEALLQKGEAFFWRLDENEVS